MRRHTRPAAGLFLALVLVALAIGCRQDIPPLYRRNQPPETTLTIVPEDSAFAFYRYHVYWRGTDMDGRVIRYMFAITDTLSRLEEDNWNPEIAEDREKGIYTTKTDSVFTFDSARGRLCFNITAIDDYGARDPSPARAYFRTTDNGLPRVEFIDVQGFRPGVALEPCAGDSCVVPMFTNFKIRFRGTTGNNQVTGLQWQCIRPGEVSPEPFQPGNSDSFFLATDQDAEQLADNGVDTLWTLRDRVVTAFYYNPPTVDSIPAGNFVLRAVARDEARRVSSLSSGTLRVKVNFDPQTRLLRIPACDCPHPRPEWVCGRDSVKAGWIVGIDQTAISDSSQWTLFCDGDTLPQLSWVRFYERGWDDPRDVATNPDGQKREVGFSNRFTWLAGSPPEQLSSSNMPFSAEYRAQDYVLPPPYSSLPWRGFRHGWGDPENFKGLCPFDFTYFAAAVDEHGTRDGSPDAIHFSVSGSPTIDSVTVPAVIVLVPSCPNFFEPFCPNLATTTPFGRDTLAVVGTYVADPTMLPPRGVNQFRLPLQAYGHDSPRDLDPRIDPSRAGRILSWKYSFNCAASGCQDLVLGGEDNWRFDAGEVNVFDDVLQATMPTDTVTTTGGLPYRVVLPNYYLGAYEFTIQGKDTDAIGGQCFEPSDLGPHPFSFSRSTENGRLTQVVVRPTKIVQMQDVRPYVQPPLAARPAPPRKGGRP